MNLPSDLKAYKAPVDAFQVLDDAEAFGGLVALALLLLAFWGAYG